jgi:hypothetical protein
MATESAKRLQASLKTPSSTFHQATAISQNALNEGLYYLFDKYEDLAKIKVTSKKFGTIDADMDRSEIVLPVNTPNYRTVYFYCIFKSGSLVLTDDKG